MSDTFEAWWSIQGARYNTGDHKERARHAYEAGARSATLSDTVRAEWLDVLAEEMEFQNRILERREAQLLAPQPPRGENQ